MEISGASERFFKNEICFQEFKIATIYLDITYKSSIQIFSLS